MRAARVVLLSLSVAALSSPAAGQAAGAGRPEVVEATGAGGPVAGEAADDHLLVKLLPGPLLARVQGGMAGIPAAAAPELADRLNLAVVEPLFSLESNPSTAGQARVVQPGGITSRETEQERSARRRRAGLDRWIVAYPLPDESLEDASWRLTLDPMVEAVELDHRGHGGGRPVSASDAWLPDDPQFAQQWYLDQASDADIDMPEAWDIRRSTPVVVAVLDSGADFAHPDLAGRLIPGRDFVNRDDNPSDDNGHGTHVTGLVAARGGNGTGIAGSAYDARVLVVKVLDVGNRGYYSWWARGIAYAVDAGVPIISLSLGGTDPSLLLEDALAYAHDRGVIVVAAMLNDNTSEPLYPAAYAQTIAVGATDELDRRAAPFSSGEEGSNYGPHIDLVAPGNNILSTARGGGYTLYAGTSQATPLVVGTLALMMGPDGSMDPEEARRILRETADDEVGRPSEDLPGFDIYHGAGRLNAAAAIAATVRGGAPPPRLELPPPYPNPSRGLVRLGFDLPADGPVTVRLYDVRGRRIRVLADGETFPAGRSYVSWDGRLSSGDPAATGIYLYEVLTPQGRGTGRLLHIR